MNAAATALLLLGGIWVVLGALYLWNIALVTRWSAPVEERRTRGNAYEMAVRFMGPLFLYGGLVLLSVGDSSF